MEPADTVQVLDGFAAKWIAAEPELGIALNFLPMPQRAVEAAFVCLGHEIANAAFAIREGDVAVAKLNWWHEELLRTSQGAPRHPLTEVLAGHAAMGQVPSSLWQALIAAAVQQRERDPAEGFATLIAGFETFFLPLAGVEAVLFNTIDRARTSRITSLAHALRELGSITRVLETGHVALPLDLLARYQLRRDQLASDSPERRRAAKEQLRAISSELDSIATAQPKLTLARYASLVTDRWRSDKASTADDPIAELNRLLPRVPMGTTWNVWRAARKHSPATTI